MTVDQSKLQLLLDKEDIREVVLRLARGIDRHDEELAADAYHPDAIDDHGAFIGPARDFIADANASHALRWTFHQHSVTNHIIEVDGDIAHSEAHFIALLRRIDGNTLDVGVGRYIDRFEKRDGTWRIAQRVCALEWVGEVTTRDSAARPPDLYIRGTWDRSDVSYDRPLQTSRPHRAPEPTGR